jgi:hypothetical protein
MANPNPVITREFLEQQFKRQFDEPLAKMAIAVRFKESVDKKLRSKTLYSDIIRLAVDEHLAKLELETKPTELQPVRQAQGLHATLFDDGRPMAKVGTRVPATVHDLVQALPHRSEWLRRVITEAAQRELIKDGEA